MNEVKLKSGTKVKYFLLACLPAICLLGIQVFAVIVFALREIIAVISDILNANNQYEIMSKLDSVTKIDVTKVSLLYEIIALVCFACWYKAVAKKDTLEAPANVRNIKSISYIIGLCVCSNIIINFLLSIVGIVFPKVMESYNKMMESAGLDEISALMILTATILAPIVEELAFRGCTMKIAQKGGFSVKAIIIMQAVLFGAAHMNIIQSSYAFALGLLLGFIYYRYDSLWMSILFHVVFNLLGTVASALLSNIKVFSYMMVSIVFVIIALYGMYYFCRKIINDTNRVEVENNMY